KEKLPSPCLKGRMNLSEYHDLEQTLLNAFGSDFQEADFQELALRVYDFQWRHNLPYQRYCHYLGLPRATKWEAIPAISTDAFKSADLVSFPVDQSQKCFRTSGTTRDERGKHHFLNTKLYEKSILEGWAQL